MDVKKWMITIKAELLQHVTLIGEEIPAASHFGDVRQRQIRSIRNILAATLMKEHGHRLNEEVFRTLLCEAEAIINNRVPQRPTFLNTTYTNIWLF